MQAVPTATRPPPPPPTPLAAGPETPSAFWPPCKLSTRALAVTVDLVGIAPTSVTVRAAGVSVELDAPSATVDVLAVSEGDQVIRSQHQRGRAAVAGLGIAAQLAQPADGSPPLTWMVGPLSVVADLVRTTRVFDGPALESPATLAGTAAATVSVHGPLNVVVGPTALALAQAWQAALPAVMAHVPARPTQAAPGAAAGPAATPGALPLGGGLEWTSTHDLRGRSWRMHTIPAPRGAGWPAWYHEQRGNTTDQPHDLVLDQAAVSTCARWEPGGCQAR